MTRTVLLVGAGIGFDPPTSFAGAGEIIAELLRDLATSAQPFVGTIHRRLAELNRRLANERLELLLELVARECGRDLAIEPLVQLCRLVPNFNHAVISWLDEPILTTNQDELIEAAAAIQGAPPPQVRHLHGRCGNRRSIITLLGEYLSPWQRDLLTDVREMLDGATLLVLGYSGRDRDLMAVLATSGLTGVVWLSHSGGVTPDVHRLAEALGPRFVIQRADAASWLGSRLTRPQADRARSVESCAKRAQRRRPVVFDPVDGAFALCRLLERVGMASEAERVTAELLAGGAPRSRTLFMRGRVRIQLGNNRGALRDYRAAERHEPPGSDLALAAKQGLIELLRSTSRYADAMREIDELIGLLDARRPSVFRDRQKSWALNAKAGNERVNGQLRQAAKTHRLAQSAAMRARNLDSYVESRIWQAETFVQLGELDRAVRALDEVDIEVESYGRRFTDGWPRFVRSEALGLIGQTDQATNAIEESLRMFRRSDNRQGIPWALLQLAGLERITGLRAAEAILDDADTELTRSGTLGLSLNWARLRLLLERAELERSRGRAVDARTALAEFHRRLRTDRRRGLTAILQVRHAELVDSLLGDQTNLRAIANGYQELGAEYFALLAMLLALRREPSSSQFHRLQHRAARMGWDRLADPMIAETSRYFPLLFV